MSKQQRTDNTRDTLVTRNVISCVAGWAGAKNTSIQEHQQRGLDAICNKRVAPHGTAILNTISILQGIKL